MQSLDALAAQSVSHVQGIAAEFLAAARIGDAL
jgi:hypothetical protein